MKSVRNCLLALAIASGVTPALACLWDRDTLAAELEGIPDVGKIAVGRFERNPPLYYEQRLERARDHLAEHPGDLDALDDAAVALDRLGRPSEAIEFMERKARVLEEVGGGDGPVGHRYRYLANLGTFHAHRWISDGADRSDLADLERARDLIAQAIQENPDAHFGRETYQLRVLEFLLEPVAWAGRDVFPNVLGLRHRMTMHDRDYLAEQGMPDAVEGLSGLISMGAAWRSVDVYHALAVALETDGRNSAAYVVRKRIAELIAEGHGSMVPGAPTGAELHKLVSGRHSLLMDHKRAQLERWFVDARKSARTWHAERERFLLQRLGHGLHPDTDPDFWDGFESATEHPAPPSAAGADAKAGKSWGGTRSPDQGHGHAESEGSLEEEQSRDEERPRKSAERDSEAD